MKFVSIVLCITCVTPLAYSQVKGAARPRITVDQIYDSEIIGRLGVPLGTCVQIQATIAAGPNPVSKVDSSDGYPYVLNITHVENQKLLTPQSRRFSKFRSDIKLASNRFDLYELRTGKKATSVDPALLPQMENGYVGKSVVLTVYETAGFDGIPNRFPPHLVYQDRGFHFHDTLVVVDQLR